MRKITFQCAVLMALASLCSDAAEFAFYKSFTTLVDTNRFQWESVRDPVLVDTNNTSSKFANIVLSVEQIRNEGRVGPLRLGMSMDEVVALFGKPKWLHPNCDGGHQMNFADCSLVFTGNSLSKIRFGDAVTFNHGLSATANLRDWTQVLGAPTIQHGVSHVYESKGKPRTVLLLTFHEDGESLFPPALYLDPPLTNWFKKVQQ
jgi:hypothetical protein